MFKTEGHLKKLGPLFQDDFITVKGPIKKKHVGIFLRKDLRGVLRSQ
jgi:hypothetical protein